MLDPNSFIRRYQEVRNANEEAEYILAALIKAQGGKIVFDYSYLNIVDNQPHNIIYSVDVYLRRVTIEVVERNPVGKSD